MRNRLNGVIRENDEQKVFMLYEINNSFNHHHRVVFTQEVEVEEISTLIEDLENVISRIKEWQMWLRKDVDDVKSE